MPAVRRLSLQALSLHTPLLVVGAVALLPVVVLAVAGLVALGRQQHAQVRQALVERSRAIASAVVLELFNDPALLRQVFMNLIGNAFKYSGKAERPRVEIGCERRGGEDLYFVRDNGVGFDMNYAGKLFGVFQRLHGDEEFEGTGVGLAIVQRIVHRHGGRIWAQAEPGKGATFYFTRAAPRGSQGASGP